MTSVSGSTARRGRRLSDMLEEQQEPFRLDVYLLENGYSQKLLAPETPVTCWPGTSTCKRQKNPIEVGFKRRRCGFMRFVLTNLVFGKSRRKALKCSNSNGSGIRLDSPFCEEESNHTQEFDRRLVSAEQCSPLSVLERGSNDHSKEEEHSSSSINSLPSTESSSIYEELYDSISSLSPVKNGRTKREYEQLDRLLWDCVREVEQRLWEVDGCFGAEVRGRAIEQQFQLWRTQRDGCSIKELMNLDLTNSAEWNLFKPQLREIGVEVEEVLFEEIIDEAILDMIGFCCT